jgi:ketosteroid isomerase-like protein
MGGRGPEAVVAYLREVQDPWERLDVALGRLIDVGDRVVAFMLETGHARHADLEVHRQTAMVFKVAGQKIIELRGYLDRAEALRAAEDTR